MGELWALELLRLGAGQAARRGLRSAWGLSGHGSSHMGDAVMEAAPDASLVQVVGETTACRCARARLRVTKYKHPSTLHGAKAFGIVAAIPMQMHDCGVCLLEKLIKSVPYLARNSVW